MPQAFLSCVSDLKKQGKSDDSAYAICVDSYKKSNGGKSPFKDKKEIQELPVSQYLKNIFEDMLNHPESTVMQEQALKGVAEGRKTKVIRADSAN